MDPLLFAPLVEGRLAEMSSAPGGWRRLVLNEDGQDLVEYAMLVACIALLIVGTLRATDTSIAALFAKVIASLGAAS